MPPRPKRRRIAVVTGTRAEYGLLRTTLRALAATPRVELRIVAAGMHLLRDCGMTIREIGADGWPIACRAPMQRGDGAAADQGVGLGRGVGAISRYLVEDDIDIVVVLGDRIEAMAGALAATTTGRVLAHIHGGDVAEGDFDDALRHSITKLAHLHFVASADARRRVLRLGESPRRVWRVGAPGLDDIAAMLAQCRQQGFDACRVGSARHAPDCEYARSCYRTGSHRQSQVRIADRKSGGLSPRYKCCNCHPPAQRDRGQGQQKTDGGPCPSYAVVIQHPCGRAEGVEYAAARAMLDAVAAAGLRRCIILPNSDRGRAGVLRAIGAHEKQSGAGEVEVFASLARDEFIRRLLGARLLVGNSSCGITEAPFAGVASVDIGPRQAGRLPGLDSVVHSPESAAAIARAVRAALALKLMPGRMTRYGGGGAGARIAAILGRIPITSTLSKKRIGY